MSTRVMVEGEGEEAEELSQSGKMISEGRTSYYNYRPGIQQDQSDLAENYTDFISILEDYRATDNDNDDDGIIDKKLIRGSLDLANPSMKDDNQVRSQSSDISVTAILVILFLPKSPEYLMERADPDT